MKTFYMIYVEMANEQRNWFVFFDVFINLVNSVASVKNNVTVLTINQNTRSIPSWGRIPTVRAKKMDFHKQRFLKFLTIKTFSTLREPFHKKYTINRAMMIIFLLSILSLKLSYVFLNMLLAL